jgi:hypothetical protein
MDLKNAQYVRAILGCEMCENGVMLENKLKKYIYMANFEIPNFRA